MTEGDGQGMEAIRRLDGDSMSVNRGVGEGGGVVSSCGAGGYWDGYLVVLGWLDKSRIGVTSIYSVERHRVKVYDMRIDTSGHFNSQGHTQLVDVSGRLLLDGDVYGMDSELVLILGVGGCLIGLRLLVGMDGEVVSDKVSSSRQRWRQQWDGDVAGLEGVYGSCYEDIHEIDRLRSGCVVVDKGLWLQGVVVVYCMGEFMFIGEIGEVLLYWEDVVVIVESSDWEWVDEGAMGHEEHRVAWTVCWGVCTNWVGLWIVEGGGVVWSGCGDWRWDYYGVLSLWRGMEQWKYRLE
ncbi:hypothetical protein Tco_1466670 [Tanacetum coccineum]